MITEPKKQLVKKTMKGLTLIEMVIAMGLLAAVFSVVIPQLRILQKSWALKDAQAESLQGGRVLIEHLQRNLSQAASVTQVSSDSDKTGYIEFTNSSGQSLRYELSQEDYVQFGPVGSLADLAGIVDEFQLTCYSLDDLESPTTVVGGIRLIQIRFQIVGVDSTVQQKEFSTTVYLRGDTASLEIPENPEMDWDEFCASYFDDWDGWDDYDNWDDWEAYLADWKAYMQAWLDYLNAREDWDNWDDYWDSWDEYNDVWKDYFDVWVDYLVSLSRWGSSGDYWDAWVDYWVARGDYWKARNDYWDARGVYWTYGDAYWD